jgi:Rrf2 family transcriptional regulator, nitric oxide-sensitive transcriptional repressor
MRLTSFTDYTLRVLLFLGTHDDESSLVTIGDIAASYGISNNHLMKVVHYLGKHGYISTLRGKGGGMRLARKPHDINVGELVRATESDLALVECFQPGNMRCPITPVCELRNVLGQALDAFLDVLDRYTLADLLEPRAKLNSAFHKMRIAG